MNTINRLLINICSDRLSESKAFYTKLFDFNVDFDSDWFIHLISKDKQLELGIIDRTNDLIPKSFQQKPQGIYLTFVVENADDVYSIALAEKMKVLEEPADTAYGQLRFLIQDPNGMMIDVSSPITGFTA